VKLFRTIGHFSGYIESPEKATFFWRAPKKGYMANQESMGYSEKGEFGRDNFLLC